jgi:D-sedoheptulose 7-phosphate isomerase
MKNDYRYISDILEFLKNDNFILTLDELTKIIIKIRKQNKRVFIFGNGGSATTAAHFQLDLSNKCSIKSMTYNLPETITCFANDYGFNYSIKKYLEIYLEKNDLVILISSSGESSNMIEAAKFVKKTNKLITLTGLNKNNRLSKIGLHNLYVNSKNYNVVETIHLIFLLQVIENLIKYDKLNKKKL